MNTPGSVVSIVLAAGAGERFGGTKQLAELGGRPLLRYALDASLAGPATATVLVLGAQAEEIEGALDLEGVAVTHCAEWSLGSGASLRCGLAAAMEADAEVVLVTLGDEPFVPAGAASRLLAARRPGVDALRAAYDGRPGHPVLIERALFGPLVEALPGTKPGVLLKRAGVIAVDCTDLGSPLDVDTPAQLEALRDDLRAADPRRAPR
ncbi:MAG: nucleotidyltransferase family protein [Actinobacteria bacterium]|nr:nucleotidyltransferase family protein [Actinomycetota bacterium]